MDTYQWGHLFNDIVMEASKKTVAIFPEGTLDLLGGASVQGLLLRWSWRLWNKIPDDVVAGLTLYVGPDSFRQGLTVVLQLGAHRGEDKKDKLELTYWSKFVDFADLKYDSLVYNQEKEGFKIRFADEMAFNLRRACDYILRVAPRLQEISANRAEIYGEMRSLSFSFYR